MNTLRIHFAQHLDESVPQRPVLTVEARVLVDGIDLGEGAGYVFDWLWLVAQGAEGGEFDLFTCSCGVPGCAGIHESCVLHAEVDRITWALPETAYAALLRPRVVPQGAPLRFVFEREAYLQALEASLVEFESLQAAHPWMRMGGFVDYDEPLADVAPATLPPVRSMLTELLKWRASLSDASCGGTD